MDTGHFETAELLPAFISRMLCLGSIAGMDTEFVQRHIGEGKTCAALWLAWQVSFSRQPLLSANILHQRKNLLIASITLSLSTRKTGASIRSTGSFLERMGSRMPVPLQSSRWIRIIDPIPRCPSPSIAGSRPPLWTHAFQLIFP